MNRRRLILLLLLVAAAWLALFGDKTPSDAPAGDVVQAAAARAGEPPGAGVSARRRPTPAGRAGAAARRRHRPDLEVAALIPRDS
jgi:hypothetical protein